MGESKINFRVFINMKPLFDIKKLEQFSPHEKLPLECECCKNIFYSIKKEVKKVLNNHPTVKLKNCSLKCRNTLQRKTIITNCCVCNKNIIKLPKDIRKSKSGNIFCSRSCAAIYNNTHKTTGIRISKLELWLQTKLTEQYPNLEIHYNRKDTINSELDIYIPSLKLAFELNGIFHYEPIYGEDKLNQIQNNDNRKFQACLEQGIELCIIDTSQQKYFKENTSKKYFNIITKIISKNVKIKLGCKDGTDPSSQDSQSCTSP